MAAKIDSSDFFNSLSSKITQVLYGRTQNDRSVINKTLDELNSFNYKYPVVTNPTKAVLLVNQCCSLIPPEDLELVQKCCQLITNLTIRQNLVIEGRTLTVAVQWCLQALKGENSDTDILVALDALLRVNTKHDLINEIVKNSVIVELSKNGMNPEKTLFSLQCLEACTCPPEDLRNVDADKFINEYKICFDIFLGHLMKNNLNIDKLLNVKIRTICLRGLQNIIIQKPSFLHDNLGIILGVIKTYMLFGINGIDFLLPQKLMPSTMSIPEPSPNMIREKKGGKMTKQRKQRTQGPTNKIKKKDEWNEEFNSTYTPATAINMSVEEGSSNLGNRLVTSDSEFSDTEGGNNAKLSVMTGRVRQAALGLFLHSVKLTEKTVMFSYWSSFIPENPLSGKHNLLTCVMKDTSARGRMGALNVLLALLTSSKLHLAQAEKGENLSFTPFSVTVALTIRELHKCLCLALNENSIPVLTQVLKCLAALVQATPYHRLSPGLMAKVIRNVKSLVYHKDPTVQVTALIVAGCALASEPPIPETEDAFLGQSERAAVEARRAPPRGSSDGFDFAEFSSDEEEMAQSKGDVPWLLERCLLNLGVSGDCDLVAENATPTPVKLESLQIMSAVSRNHFEAMLAPHLNLVTKAVDAALASKYTDVRLHAGRAADFLGQAMNRYMSNENAKLFTVDHFLPFWQVLLDGSLTALLQCEQPILRAVGCDCLGSVGAYAFEQLPRDKQILCVTLLFACSRDEENSVKGAAVRALAICVLYPSLREDLGFVVDTAEAIHRVLQEENLAVKIKCSWALGNLSEALVLNKSNPDLTDEFPNALMLKLLKATTKASNESDKVKMNTVRALGNILQLIDEDLIEEAKFKEAVQEAMDILVKNCTSGSNMKVRWNSCYALGNAMKNPSLFATTINWQEKVFNGLTDLVVNFRNFKVRINAAVALQSPTKREYYKQYYQLVWIALIKGLETSQNMEDFSEYKHRDHLVEQICLTLGHLMTLLTKEDLILLKDCICSDYFKLQMGRVWERLLPEKTTVLFDAHAYVTSMMKDPDLTSEQKSVLHYLQKLYYSVLP